MSRALLVLVGREIAVGIAALHHRAALRREASRQWWVRAVVAPWIGWLLPALVGLLLLVIVAAVVVGRLVSQDEALWLAGPKQRAAGGRP